jgi:hypothetical protein
MDKRTIQSKDITKLLYFIAGVFICAIGIKLDAYLKLPTWESKQAKLINTLELKSPIQQYQLVTTVNAQEATRSPEIKEVKKVVISPRAEIHSQKRPEIAQKLLAKFGEPEILELISRESGLNPQAINPSSGACGLFQAYPCSKLPCSLDDVDGQIEWGYKYIINRYGSAKQALEFHNQKNWY